MVNKETRAKNGYIDMLPDVQPTLFKQALGTNIQKM